MKVTWSTASEAAREIVTVEEQEKDVWNRQVQVLESTASARDAPEATAATASTSAMRVSFGANDSKNIWN